MALTVEELQIVLSCDATTAQTVLKQMDATVKAYTEKFQRYFNTMGGKKGGSGLDNVSKNATNAAKRVKDLSDSLRTMERNEYKVGKVLSNSDISSKINENIQKGWANKDIYKDAAKEVEEIYQQMSKVKPSKDYYKQVRAGNMNAENNPQWGHEGEGKMLAPSFGETIRASLASMPEMINSFVMSSTNSLMKVGGVLGKVFVGGSKLAIGALNGIVTVAGKVGGAIKKAFSNSLLGKFLKRLGSVMMRMAAMKLIRGTIDGAKKGLEELAKSSDSSAKAMNQIKAAGGSIKMALGAALMPIVKALAPLFYQLAVAINTACNAIAQFFAVITGQGTYTATHLSGALDDVASSAGGAGKAVKGTLAAFDELVVIGNRAGGGGGGGGVGQSFSEVVDDVPAMNNLATILRNQILGGNWEGVGATLNGELGKLSTKIKKFFDDLSAKGYGKKFAQFLNGIFSDPSAFSAAGKALASGLNFVITTVSDFLKNFDVSRLVASTVALINSFVEEVDWLGLGANIGFAVLDVIEWLAGTLIGLDWGAIFRGIFDVVTGAIAEILSNPRRLVQLLKDLILGLVDLLGGLITGGLASIFDAIGLSGLADKITTAWDSAMDGISSGLDDAISHINTSWSSTGDKASAAGAKATNAFKDARSAISGTTSKVDALKGSINGIKDKKATVTITVNTKGGTNSGSGGVNVQKPTIKVNIEHFARGGIAYGPTPALIGEYAGARNNPEVVAPLSNLVNILTKAGAPKAASDEEMQLLKEQNALLRQIAQKELKLSPSTMLGQVVERSRQLYART